MELNSFQRAQYFNKGVRLYKRSSYNEALKIFSHLVEADKGDKYLSIDPLQLSYYAVCLGIVTKENISAERICTTALSREPGNQQIILNLGTLYEVIGDKRKAIRAYRNGYRKFPDNVKFLVNLQRLNPRAPVPIPFLDRDNVINKFSGILLRKGLKSFIQRK